MVRKPQICHQWDLSSYRTTFLPLDFLPLYFSLNLGPKLSIKCSRPSQHYLMLIALLRNPLDTQFSPPKGLSGLQGRPHL